MADIETVQVPKALLPLVVEYIKQASAIAEEAEAQQVKVASDVTERQNLAKQAAAELVQSGLLEKASQDNAVRKLADDPTTALKSLIKVARDIRPFNIGEGSQGASAAVAGPRSTARESDRQFLSNMGFPA